MKRLRFTGDIAFIIVTSIVSIIPFFRPGFFSMHDDTQVARVQQMTQALTDGMFPVRWVLDLGFGYGYPIFNFYAPFPYYFGSIFALITGDALLATKIAFIGAIVFSGIAMYVFMQAFFTRLSAVVAAIVYVYFPYHAVNVYVRGNLNEVFAYAFLPLVMLGFFKLYFQKKDTKASHRLYWILVTAISIALVIVSHNLSALMLGFVLAVLSLVLVLTLQNKKSFIFSLISVCSIALGISAFYWIPAIIEMGYTNVLSQVGGTADFRDHFVCTSQLWNSLWGYGGSVPGCLDGMSFKLGKMNILAGGVAAVIFGTLLILRKKQPFQYLQLGLYGIVIFSVFMTTHYSLLIWEVVPALDFLQFPWRFINMIAVSLSAIVGLLVYYISTLKGRFAYTAYLIAVGIIGVTIIINGKLFVPQEVFPERDAAYYTDKEYIRYTASSLTYEYLPKDFTIPENEDDLPEQYVSVVEGDATISSAYVTTGYLSVFVDARTESVIHVNIAYYPAWRIYSNGEEIQYKVTNQGMQFLQEPGQSIIEARFIQTTTQKVANFISLATVLCTTYLLWKYRKEWKK